ncbi:vegetative cell wall protein gp1-like [Delphinapterus leucas]|uniref:Vegetative cell wall protein gp1-like n=1 Tax=Delphinapterus leucas TaxID=9749 RepID=A0A2Y9MXZ7_DELLE|nr:vegetative cell wall protein gp1-like [Delphinapterus leucas]
MYPATAPLPQPREAPRKGYNTSRLLPGPTATSAASPPALRARGARPPWGPAAAAPVAAPPLLGPCRASGCRGPPSPSGLPDPLWQPGVPELCWPTRPPAPTALPSPGACMATACPSKSRREPERLTRPHPFYPRTPRAPAQTPLSSPPGTGLAAALPPTGRPEDPVGLHRLGSVVKPRSFRMPWMRLHRPAPPVRGPAAWSRRRVPTESPPRQERRLSTPKALTRLPNHLLQAIRATHPPPKPSDPPPSKAQSKPQTAGEV